MAQNLTLEDMKKFVNKSGLVPMIIVRSHAPYFKGETAGFSPPKALEEFNAGRAVPKEIAGEVESGRVQPAPLGSVGVSTKSLKRNLGTKLTDKPDLATVDIPKNWQTREFGALNRIRLAKRLTGATDKKMKDPQATEIITAELAKREAEKA